MSNTDTEKLVTQQFMEGSTIFSAGDEATEAYLIQDGEIIIKKDDKEIATLGQGDIFGEMAIIKNIPHSSNAVANTKTTLVVITKDVLHQKIEESDPLIAGLLHMFIKRLYKSNEQLGE